MEPVTMATPFMVEERIRQGGSAPLLGCSDIGALLAHFLPRRAPAEEEILRQFVVRHRNARDLWTPPAEIETRDTRRSPWDDSDMVESGFRLSIRRWRCIAGAACWEGEWMDGESFRLRGG